MIESDQILSGIGEWRETLSQGEKHYLHTRLLIDLETQAIQWKDSKSKWIFLRSLLPDLPQQQCRKQQRNNSQQVALALFLRH